jgi:membrane associated rhomboid family serine protease
VLPFAPRERLSSSVAFRSATEAFDGGEQAPYGGKARYVSLPGNSRFISPRDFRMIIIPTGTDAPIYHWPYATVGLIVVNVALLFAVPPRRSEPKLDENDNVIAGAQEVTNFERYALAIGDGRLHPIQWVTHNFLHFDIVHVLGNMLFLWAFGIVVEGKLGAVKYLLLYLAIGTLHGAFVQSLLVRSGLGTHAAGASAVVYGLLAVCMVWAPRNELNCTVILVVGFRVLVYHWDLYYTTVALLYIGEQALGLAFWGAVGRQLMLSELGHLSGALWGGVLAVAMLKANLVDCEEWDIFTLWSKWRKLGREWKKRGERHERQKDALRASVRANVRSKAASQETDEEADGPSRQERAAAAVKHVHWLVEKGNIAGALRTFQKSASSLPTWPAQTDLYGLIKAFHAKGALVDSIPLMRDHCRLYPDQSTAVRLKLAQVLIRECQRPQAALRVLNEFGPAALPSEAEAVRQKLIRHADRLCAEGVIEVEGDG